MEMPILNFMEGDLQCQCLNSQKYACKVFFFLCVFWSVKISVFVLTCFSATWQAIIFVREKNSLRELLFIAAIKLVT